MRKLMVLLISLLVVAIAYGQRDPFLWPFQKESIWNMPIHNNAVYYDIPDSHLPPHDRYGLDENHILHLTSNFPQRSVYGNQQWGPGRCRNDQGFLYTVNFPDDYVVPDATSGNTPNNNFAFMLSDNTSIRTGNVLARCAAGGPVYHRTWYKTASVSGDGITNQNGQGASGMSAMGGTIRNKDIDLGEIRHAIKFTLYAKQYFYHSGPNTTGCASNSSCYRWPANACDCYGDDYLGVNSKLVMGVLLAIRPDVTVASQNFETGFAPVIFTAMQKYGGYAVEDSAWSKWYLIGERGVRSRVQSKYGIDIETGGQNTPWKRDMDKIVRLLQIVDNNGPSNIGGGPNSDYANRRAPMACDFGTVGSGSMCPGGGGGGGTPTSYEAEASGNTIAGNARIIDKSSASGGKAVGYIGNGSGNYLEVNNINASSAGNHTVRVYYISGETRTLYMSVNGGTAVSNSVNSGGWNTVAYYDRTVSLTAGSNKIKFFNNSALAPDVDRIVVTKQ